MRHEKRVEVQQQKQVKGERGQGMEVPVRLSSLIGYVVGFIITFALGVSFVWNIYEKYRLGKYMSSWTLIEYILITILVFVIAMNLFSNFMVCRWLYVQGLNEIELTAEGFRDRRKGIYIKWLDIGGLYHGPMGRRTIAIEARLIDSMVYKKQLSWMRRMWVDFTSNDDVILMDHYTVGRDRLVNFYTTMLDLHKKAHGA